MDSVTVAMEDLKDQDRDSSSWRKSIYVVLRVDSDLMAHNQAWVPDKTTYLFEF